MMTASVVTADPETSVQEVAALMRERNVGSVVLVRDGAAIGIVTDRVAGYASTPLVTGNADMDVEAAAALMVSHGIRRLPIADGGKLTGILTLDDLAARTGDAELPEQLAGQITRAALPDFYFHNRGG